jgi:preprotein translocase subunit SecG
MEFLSTILLVFFVLVAVLLIGMVLIQDEQGDGLAGMFGGGSQTTFGSRAGNVLTRTTSVLGALFIVVALGLALMYKTSETGDVAAAARQQNAATEWWNAAPAAQTPAVPAPAEPAPAADTSAAPAAQK